MKKLISILVAISLVVLSFAACAKTEAKPVIGIIQFGSHASLNNCYQGVLKGLQEGGIDINKYTIEYSDSNFDPSVSQTQANNLVNKKAAVIIAIATPSAVAAANAAADSGIPVVYCAVTDPQSMANYTNITGSSDIPNFEKQLEVVVGCMGRSDLKIGVLSSTEEQSSPIQIENLKKAATQYVDMEILSSVVADITTIDAKVNELISRDIDCMINLLDNTIVGKLETNILPITNEKKIPVFGSEIEQVKLGCVASASIEYFDVGSAAGSNAARILLGESADNIPVATISEPHNYYNSEAIQDMGIIVPADMNMHDVTKDVVNK